MLAMQLAFSKAVETAAKQLSSAASVQPTLPTVQPDEGGCTSVFLDFLCA